MISNKEILLSKRVRIKKKCELKIKNTFTNSENLEMVYCMFSCLELFIGIAFYNGMGCLLVQYEISHWEILLSTTIQGRILYSFMLCCKIINLLAVYEKRQIIQ